MCGGFLQLLLLIFVVIFMKVHDFLMQNLPACCCSCDMKDVTVFQG